jgi:hypothetical protein
MRGTATLPLPLWNPGTGREGDLRRVVQGLASSRAVGRPRSVSETHALAEIENGRCTLDLAGWEGIAGELHRAYRARGVPYADVDPEQAARAAGVRLVWVHGLWRPHYDPETRIAQLAPRADPQAQAFDTLHEVCEAKCVGRRARHADVQWVTIASMVEYEVARSALRAHGLRGGVASLARKHRRYRRCFLWVRLAMVAAAG